MFQWTEVHLVCDAREGWLSPDMNGFKQRTERPALICHDMMGNISR